MIRLKNLYKRHFKIIKHLEILENTKTSNASALQETIQYWHEKLQQITLKIKECKNTQNYI